MAVGEHCNSLRKSAWLAQLQFTIWRDIADKDKSRGWVLFRETMVYISNTHSAASGVSVTNSKASIHLWKHSHSGTLRPGSIILRDTDITICPWFMEVISRLRRKVAMFCTCFCDSTMKLERPLLECRLESYDTFMCNDTASQRRHIFVGKALIYPSIYNFFFISACIFAVDISCLSLDNAKMIEHKLLGTWRTPEL